jgi:ABC-type multidrug transport system ATPase subunit
VIEFNGVGKVYRSFPLGREVRAVDDLTLSVRPGEVLGIAGPNGAGKSTLIAMLLGYLRPSEGRITIGGLPPRAFVERHGVGYLSELVGIPPRWTVEGALERYGILAGIGDAELPARIEDVLERMGLHEHRDKRVNQLSKGNLQRLGLGQTLLRPYDLFVLDEPTHGLDPMWTVKFREMVAELRRPERIVIIASHNLEELERLADRVAIIDRGRLQRVVTVSRVLPMTAASVYRLTLAGGADAMRTVFPDAIDLGRGDWAVTAASLADLNERLAAMIGRGAVVAGLAPAESALEREFRDAVEGVLT